MLRAEEAEQVRLRGLNAPNPQDEDARDKPGSKAFGKRLDQSAEEDIVGWLCARP